jgi:hypothetical protein
MRLRPLRVALPLALWVISSGTPPEAVTYDCFAVDTQATTYSNEPVSVSEDKAKKTCTFSVAGATRAQPPQEIQRLLLAALPSLRFARPPDVSTITQAVPHLLAASGPTADGTVPPALDELLKGNAVTLRNCLQRFFVARETLPPVDPQKHFGCGAKGSQGSDIDILEIVARFETYLNRLFLIRAPAR